MREFNYPLDPAETLSIRRIFSFDRVPNKGKGAYSVSHELRRFLLDNGWELIGSHRRNPLRVYLRAPVESESFLFLVAIPSDQAILRIAGEMIAQSASDGHLRNGCYSGSIGEFSVTFNPHGVRTYDDPSNVISEQERHRDQSPTLHVARSGIWSTQLCWLNGLEQPPIWNREESFSALVPGLSFRGVPFSELEAIHAAELKRYEESVASRKVD
jgi:hypothetical protein